MTAEFKRRGWAVNHKRVYSRLVYTGNLARQMSLTGLDQLWVADITYIRLELDFFVYLAVILEAFSRRVIGWALALARWGTRASLGASLRSRRSVRQPRSHATAQKPWHPDQHVAEGQSMGQCGCESFLKTLKYEEVYRTEYRDLAGAQASLAVFLEKAYDPKTPALGARLLATRAEFERGLLAQTLKEAASRQLSL